MAFDCLHGLENSDEMGMVKASEQEVRMLVHDCHQACEKSCQHGWEKRCNHCKFGLEETPNEIGLKPPLIRVIEEGLWFDTRIWMQNSIWML